MDRTADMSTPTWVNGFDDPEHEMWGRLIMFPRKGRPRLDFLIRELAIEGYAYVPPQQPKMYVVIFPTVAAMMAFRELCKHREIELPPLARIDVLR